jgi:hypothetical protein
MSRKLKAPFPWFGGKSRVAALVWERFGDVPNYVEPFFGSGAVLLARPHPARIETINDKDCYVANFWRAVQHDPEAVAHYADWPVNEADLHARHKWLVNQSDFIERMRSEPDYYDARVAGWWVWGISCWIGSGWCSKPEWSGRISATFKARGVNAEQQHVRPSLTQNGVHRAPRNHGNDPETNHRRPHLSPNQGVHAGFEKTRPNLQPQGVHHTTRQKRPRISGFADAGVHAPPITDGSKRRTPNAERPTLNSEEERNPRNAGLNVWEKRPALHRSNRGANRQLKQQVPDLGGDSGAAGRGVHASGKTIALIDWMQALADRLRNVRVCCGDWTRILGRSPTECIGLTGIFLDPPYDLRLRDTGVYSHDDELLSTSVRRYAIAHGQNPKLRIALCGYEGEHKMPKNWTCLAWKANGGHGNAGGRGEDAATPASSASGFHRTV